LKPAIRKKTDRKIVAGCSFVARQRPPSFWCPYQENPFGNLKFDALDHPPCSSELVPSYFHLIWPLKEALRGSPICKWWRSEGSCAWLAPHSTKRVVFLKTCDHWTNCIEKHGDCVGKWYSCKRSEQIHYKEKE
jgi:hypothetical protein